MKLSIGGTLYPVPVAYYCYECNGSHIATRTILTNCGRIICSQCGSDRTSIGRKEIVGCQYCGSKMIDGVCRGCGNQ